MNNVESYRDDLAKNLRVSDRLSRREILRSEKGTDRYVFARSRHDHKRYETGQNRIFEDIILSVDNLQDLKDEIAKTNLFIRNGVCGFDHVEHFLKKIDMAHDLACPKLLPETSGLRTKVRDMLGNEGVEMVDTVDLVKYREYLAKKLSTQDFTPIEIEAISSKVPVELLASIDEDIEDAVMELNAIPGIKTKYSCSGHVDDLECESTLRGGEILVKSQNTELSEYLNVLASESDSYSVSVEKWDDDEFGIFFMKNVPREWMTKNGRRTPDELFDESKKKLSLILGPEILDYPTEKSKIDRPGFLELVLELQQRYIASSPDAVTMPYAYNSILLLNLYNCYPSTLEFLEYKDYYVSESAEKEGKLFIDRLTETIRNYRVMNNAIVETRDISDQDLLDKEKLEKVKESLGIK